jgi:ubiquitin-conjugating enzyme (huntingtin interacting protein 2)
MDPMTNRRLQKEINDYNSQDATYSTSNYYSLSYDSKNLLNWSANLHCIPVKWHEGKDYNLEITLPENYPFNPPVVRFLNNVNCLCVCRETGIISIDILKTGARGGWSPAFTIAGVMVSIISVLTDEDSKRYNRRKPL